MPLINRIIHEESNYVDRDNKICSGYYSKRLYLCGVLVFTHMYTLDSRPHKPNDDDNKIGFNNKSKD